MFYTLLENELKKIILSPKALALFGISALLILGSIALGIQEYEVANTQFLDNQRLTELSLQQSRNWSAVRNMAHRQPDPMQVFASGLHFDIGRYSLVNSQHAIKLIHSPYSDEPLFALFRFLDLSFIVQVVLSLFAILLTYDAINGERESGTLKLMLTHPIPRANILLAKYVAVAITLLGSFLIPILIAVLFLQFVDIPFMPGDWIRLGALLGLSSLFLLAFTSLGLLFSSLVHQANQSFFWLLVIWVGAVLLIPRLGTMTASALIPVESVAEMESKIEAFSQKEWETDLKETVQIWKQRNAEMEGMSEEEKTSYRGDKQWEWTQADKERQAQQKARITAYSDRLREEAKNQAKFQQQLGLQLARISPAASFQLGALTVSNTNLDVKYKSMEAMHDYKAQYVDFVSTQSDDNQGLHIRLDADRGISIDFGRKGGALNTEQMPRYAHYQITPQEALSATLLDFFLLSAECLLFFGLSFFAFLRFDVR